MRRLLLCSFLTLFALPVWCDEGHQHSLTDQELGSVHFVTSCSTTVLVSFNRAVALLHSFQYEQARAAFVEVSEHDANCAMAQWGIAMTHYHGLWDNGNMAAGREALHRAQNIAAANPSTSVREKAYIEALAEIYREDGKDKTAHTLVFEQKMGALQAAYPDDTEAAIFHALSLDRQDVCQSEEVWGDPGTDLRQTASSSRSGALHHSLL
jgi:hypothetical protein